MVDAPDKGTATGKLPLLRQHNIALHSYGIPRELEVRFARVFQATLERIPCASRRKILTHWRDNTLPGRVLVEVVPFKMDFVRGHGGYAACTKCGRDLAFWSPMVDRLPDEHLSAMIAHELAHVLHWADDPAHGEDPNAEDLANAKVREWGFLDPEVTTFWIARNASDIAGGPN